jgi:hypothetical protein
VSYDALDEFDYPEDNFEDVEETEVVDDLDDELPSVDVYDDEAYYYDPYEGYEEDEASEEAEADTICTACDGTGEFPEDHLCKACNGKGSLGE